MFEDHSFTNYDILILSDLKFIENSEYSIIKLVFCCNRYSELLKMLAEAALMYQNLAFSRLFTNL